MQELFTMLTRAVEGTPLVALGAAFAWGVLSLLVSPCHLASIPLVVAFIGRQGPTSTRRAFAISVCFSLGILLTITAVGLVTAAAGRIWGDLGGWTSYAVAVVFFLVGLVLLDVIDIPWSGSGGVNTKLRGLPAAFVLGFVFGIALGPCTFTYMIPVLGVVIKVSGTDLSYAVLLLMVYAVAHCSVIVLAGTFTEVVRKYLNWNERSKGTVIVRRVCGVLVILGGLYLLYTA